MVILIDTDQECIHGQSQPISSWVLCGSWSWIGLEDWAWPAIYVRCWLLEVEVDCLTGDFMVNAHVFPKPFPKYIYRQQCIKKLYLPILHLNF